MILQGDCLTQLKQINDESVDCCITSPPYYALRDYKVDGQIGLEKTFQEYLEKLIQIFNEVKRVLKKTGTCWVVMGDTYNNSSNFRNGIGQNATCSKRVHDNKGAMAKTRIEEIPDKSLLMIPSRFAIQMIDSGWILRNDIIWYKPNCMPSSAKDRFTVDYEHVFFFTKNKKYYFKTQYEPALDQGSGWKKQMDKGINVHNKYSRKESVDAFVGFTRREIEHQMRHPDRIWGTNSSRIKRTVWKIPTKPFPEAHFAVFPEELVEQCLEPGCPEQGTVLDPFMGAGTVPLVALKTNRKFIGIELNSDYIQIAKRRIAPYLIPKIEKWIISK